MPNVIIELNTAGIGQLLKSDDVKDMVEAVAERCLTRCGDGYGASTKMTPSRVVAGVFTNTRAAAEDNSENHTLLRSLYD